MCGVVLVYLAAFAVPEGTGMMDKVKEFGHMDLVPVAFDFAEDDTCLNNDPPDAAGWPQRRRRGGSRAVPRHARALERQGHVQYLPIKHAAWREIPVAYVYCTADMTVPFDYQKSFVEAIEKAGHSVRTFELVVDAIKTVVEGWAMGFVHARERELHRTVS